MVGLEEVPNNGRDSPHLMLHDEVEGPALHWHARGRPDNHRRGKDADEEKDERNRGKGEEDGARRELPLQRDDDDGVEKAQAE